MSVAVGVAAAEGLALCVDSRTTQRRDEAEPHYRVASNSAEKLYLADGRFAIATYGIATIGGKTIRTLMEEFTPSADLELGAYAAALGDYFHGKLGAVTPHRRGDYVKAGDMSWPLGFMLVGFDPAGVGHILDIKVRAVGARVQSAEPTTENPGVVPRGQVDAIERLLDGLDWSGLEAAGVDLDAEQQDRMRLLRYDLILPTTVDDAVQLAEFLVTTQVGMQSHSDGTYASPKRVPGCGGVVRSAGVDRRGVYWIRNAGRAVVGQARPGAVSAQADEAHGRAQRSA
jgi:hypothetical protein